MRSVFCCAVFRAPGAALLRRAVVAASVVLAICLGTAAAVDGQTSVVRVEEDWELVIDQPDPNSDAPQITCVISPRGHADGLHAAFELNHQTQPDYVPGGLQLQLWAGEWPLAGRKFPRDELLGNANETIRWTQQMRIDDGVLTFEITGGTSTTWGAFGGQGYLRFAVVTSLDDLNTYSPTVSVGKSGIGYAGNRVTKLVLKEVRLYSAAGLISQDTTEKVVHQQ